MLRFSIFFIWVSLDTIMVAEFYKNIMTDFKVCVIVPTYNNSATLTDIIDRLLEFTANIIVVNDGSTDKTEGILKQYSTIFVLENGSNSGKGYSLKKGFQFALDKGFDYAITIDSDGQHNTGDIPFFLKALTEKPESLIIGARNMEQSGIPGRSSFGHKFSNFWFRFETGIKLPDTQSGFRLYPLKFLNDFKFYSNRFEFEVEVLVRAAWKGIKITSVPISVTYLPKEQRVSHFRPITDFGRISILNTILVFWAIFFVKPFRFAKRLNKKEIITFFKENIVNSKESNLKIAVSVAVGILWGILPVWGWQLAIAISLAYLLKLNKIIVIASANISIPPMIPLILFLSYKTGGLLLGKNSEIIHNISAMSLEFVRRNLVQYIAGAIVFAFVASVVLGLLTYILISVFRVRK